MARRAWPTLRNRGVTRNWRAHATIYELPTTPSWSMAYNIALSVLGSSPQRAAVPNQTIYYDWPQSATTKNHRAYTMVYSMPDSSRRRAAGPSQAMHYEAGPSPRNTSSICSVSFCPLGPFHNKLVIGWFHNVCCALRFKRRRGNHGSGRKYLGRRIGIMRIFV